VNAQGMTSNNGQRAWFVASALVLTAGLCLPASSLFGRDEPKAKQIAAIEKELNTLTAKLDELKSGPRKPLVSAGVPEDWLKSLTWRSIGPSNMGGRTIAISVFEQDPSLFWLATASGGLLKTENNGVTFQHQFDHEATVSIGDVCVAPSNRNIVWVGTGEYSPRNSVSYGDGVYKSTDGGKTWKNMGLKQSFQISRILIHPTNPDIVYVGALGRLWGPNEERGLFKTADGGKTWKKILYFDDKTGVMEARMHPTDPETILVGMYERKRGIHDENDPIKKFGPHAGLYKTTDGGKNFKRITKGLPTSEIGRLGLDFYRKNPNEVFMIMECADIGKGPARKETPAAYFGAFVRDTDEDAAQVARVADDSPAAKAGIEVGDIIETVGDKKIADAEALQEANQKYKAGDKVKVKISREGKKKEVELTYAAQPAGQQGRGGRGGAGRGGDPTRPYGAQYGGQRENMQEQQGKDGHLYGGVYKSTDVGETWTRINSIDPRPMYFSTIRVDPSDDQHLYVAGINIASSRDGGKRFRTGSRGGAGQRGAGIHDDQHALWIDPRDGRHIILAGDGGTYVTYDRMATWDHLNHMAIGQFYHVAVDPRPFYYVYGGLQDNGSWGGPGRTRTTQGPVIQDWLSVGGGDGFTCRVDPNDPDWVYTESQNGAMSRRNLRTGESGAIRPGGRGGRGGRGGAGGGGAAGGGAPGGAAAGGEGAGAAGAAAGGEGAGAAGGPGGGRGGYRWNWNTPFILSSHNSKIYYCAGNFVFRSLDRGNDLQKISPEITLTKEGSATVVAESPRNANILWAGTDDGAVWVTKDGGKEWSNLTKKFGLPGPRTVAAIEPSRYQEGRCYIVFDAHRMDDDKPYVYVTQDNGDTWKAITNNLPWGSTRTISEDIQNQDVLYVGTEFGAWVSLNRGESWLPLKGNLPTVAVHEFAQHPSTGEIVAATHGRSFWILDVSPLRQLNPEISKAPATLMKPTPAFRYRMEVARGNTNRQFIGTNPFNGASIYYLLTQKPKSITMEIQDAAGKTIRTLQASAEIGMHRINWDMTTGGGRGNRGGAGGAGGGAGRAGRGQGRAGAGAAEGQAQQAGAGTAGRAQRGGGGRAGAAGGAGSPAAANNPAGGPGGGFGGGFGGGRGGFGGPPLPSGTYRVVLKVDGKEQVQLLQATIESNAGGQQFFGEEDEEAHDRDQDDPNRDVNDPDR
jgi:photosystem II stability/assembly factor-like uncharacterized protein